MKGARQNPRWTSLIPHNKITSPMLKKVNLTPKYKLLIMLWVSPVMALEPQDAPKESVKEVATPSNTWHTDLAEAKKVAKAEGKDLLIKFTRSKGCGWCIKLEKEVLSQDSFNAAIPKDYVMVALDYPRDTSHWTEEVKMENEKLRKYYRVKHFPYLVFADAEGLPYERIKYRNREAEEYVKEVTKVRFKRKRRDSAFKAAKELEGEKKARLLEKGLVEVSRKYYRYYPDVIEAIDKADPSDASGLVAKVQVDQTKFELEDILRQFYVDRDFNRVLSTVDTYISSNNPKGEALQVALLYKVQAHYMAKNYADAKVVADELTSINEASRSASHAKSLKKRMARLEVE